MSGFVALIRTDGPPLERGDLSPFMDALTARGPHARWETRGADAALGQTLFRTPGSAELARQPVGKSDVWIVADARIDGREDLFRELGHTAPGRPMSDATLILHAYLKWGDDCLEHLLGDFSFAIWDARQPRLFCVRDQMGVKPFYYAVLPHALVVSNALDCVRRHPAVSPELNDAAIADCLLFGGNQDSHTSVYRDVMRLPAGHTLTWSPDGVRLKRYWSIPVDEPVYYRRAGDYVDRFNELLTHAVSDRVGDTPVGVLMSSGLDSTLLAATASRVLSRSSVAAPVHGFSFFYSSLIPDEESTFTALAARHLGIPLRITERDRSPAWLGADMPPSPEPLASPADPSPLRTTYREMAAHSPIALHGEGPDTALSFEWQAYVAYLRRRGRWLRLAASVASQASSRRHLPRPGAMLKEIWRPSPTDPWALDFPETLQPDLVDRLQLKQRWQEIRDASSSNHPVRPLAHASFSSASWQNMFEAFDMAHTGALLEVRHPYLDLRLLRYMLSVPALPWCRRQFLLRQAARPLLPPALVDRNRTAPAVLPDAEQARRLGPPMLYPSEDIKRFTILEKFETEGSQSVTAHQTHFHLAAVSHWLHTRDRFA